jgi:hypothetical protein
MVFVVESSEKFVKSDKLESKQETLPNDSMLRYRPLRLPR